jgi:hypothetical protein
MTNYRGGRCAPASLAGHPGQFARGRPGRGGGPDSAEATTAVPAAAAAAEFLVQRAVTHYLYGALLTGPRRRSPGAPGLAGQVHLEEPYTNLVYD